jgi:hypothetical protein
VSNPTAPYQVGDWIRFMRGGRLVVDEIAYIVPRGLWNSTPEAMTLNHGQVPFESVLEVRRRSSHE